MALLHHSIMSESIAALLSWLNSASLYSSMNTNAYVVIDSGIKVMYAYINTPQPEWKNEAERVVAIQKRMQNVSPALLLLQGLCNHGRQVHTFLFGKTG